MYDSEGQSEGLPKSSFPIYVAEGDVLFKQGEFEKALESYSTTYTGRQPDQIKRMDEYVDPEQERQELLKLLQSYIGEAEDHMRKKEYKRSLEGWNLALEIESSDKNCLVARSKCHLKLGDSKAALKDAEAALEDDPEFNKGLYQKAEALYQSGDFEMSLVYYHRGNKLRPELQEFRLGIQKAQEAIDNSIGDIANVKLDNKGDLSDFYKQDESKTKKPPRMGYSKPSTKPQEDSKKRKRRKEQSEKQKEVTKQLLGELYADKMYLDKLLKDQDLTRSDTDSGNKIYDLVSEGIDYLDTRTDFWRQQKPMYARKRDSRSLGSKQQQTTKAGSKKPVDPTKYILKNLEEIDSAMAEGQAKKALKQAQKVLKMVEGWDEEDVPDKQELVANLHSCIGNAYLDLNKMPDALHHHQADLKLSKDNDNEDGKSRALDNLGRVYARIGKFDAAVEHWGQKIALVKTPLEATWLYHEIGRCHLELGNYQEAREFGEKSFQSAQEAGDDMWQLNASVLIAQSEVKLGDIQEAIESFERSLEMAKIQGDEPAQGAISKALGELNEKIVKGLQEREAGKGTTIEENKETTIGENKGTIGTEETRTNDSPLMGSPDSSADRHHTASPSPTDDRGNSPSSPTGDRGHSPSSPTGGRGNSPLSQEGSGVISPPPDQTEPSRPTSKASVQSNQSSKSLVKSGRSSRKSSKSSIASHKSGHDERVSVKSKSRSGSAKSSTSLKQAVIVQQVNDEQDVEERPLSGRSGGNVGVDDGGGVRQDGSETVQGDHVTENGKATETYHISVKTSDDRGSGTNSNVYIVLYGEEGDSGQLMLSDSIDEWNKFEGGHTDRFILGDVKNVGEIKHILIGHDNRGAFSGWKLDSVDIEVPSLSRKLHFPCDMWLDEDEGDGKIERELQPAPADDASATDSD